MNKKGDSKKFLQQIRVGRKFQNKCLLFPEHNFFICYSGNTIRSYSTVDFSFIFQVKTGDSTISCANKLHGSENHFIVSTKNGGVYFYDVKTLSVIKYFKLHFRIFMMEPIYKDNSLLVVYGEPKTNEINYKRNASFHDNRKFLLGTTTVSLFSASFGTFQSFANIPRYGPNFVAYSSNKSLIVVTYEKSFDFYFLDDNFKKTTMVIKHPISSVSIHPVSTICALGCQNGNIEIWLYVIFLLSKRLLSISDSQKISEFHWHSSCVYSLCFCPDGTFLYSGGNEAVLVCWTVDSRENYTVPRLEENIRFITSSDKNIFVTHQNNTISIFDSSSLRLVGKITQFSRGYRSNLPVSFDFGTNCLVMSQTQGSISFYSPVLDSIIKEVDISFQNYVGGIESHGENSQFEVSHICFSRTKNWMYTAESSKLNQFSKLKSWLFHKDSRLFTHCHTIECPHKSFINHITPCTYDLSQCLDYLVSCGHDSVLNIWKNKRYDSSNKKSSKYDLELEEIFLYKDKEPMLCEFSFDQSIMSVLYYNEVLLVDFPSLSIRFSISYINPRFVVFGNSVNSSFLAISSSTVLTVYDLLLLSPIWCAESNFCSVLIDPCSQYFVAISQTIKGTYNLLIYSFCRPKPLKVLQNIAPNSTGILSAVFGSPNCFECEKILIKSCLYFITIEKDIFAICPSTLITEKETTFILDKPLPASDKILNYDENKVNKKESSNFDFLTKEREFSSKLSLTPSHVLPSPNVLCTQYMDIAFERFKKDRKAIKKTNEIITYSNENDKTEKGFASSKSECALEIDFSQLQFCF